MLTFDNKIAAIKHLREATRVTTITTAVNDRGETVLQVPNPMCLKDAKDIIEAAMALGVRQFLEDAVKQWYIREGDIEF